MRRRTTGKGGINATATALATVLYAGVAVVRGNERFRSDSIVAQMLAVFSSRHRVYGSAMLHVVWLVHEVSSHISLYGAHIVTLPLKQILSCPPPLNLAVQLTCIYIQLRID